MKRTRQLIHLGAAALALCTAPTLMAADAAESTTTGNVTVVNDYLFRGLSQSNRDPALQAGLEYDHASGWYVGGWGSSISWLSDTSAPGARVSSSVELDVYTGYRTKLGDDWTVDGGLYEYYYPGSYPHGYTRPYTLEAYAGLGWRALTLKYSQTLGNAFGVADSRNSRYLDLSWNWEFSPGWLVNAHAGRQQISHLKAASYTDWKLGLTRNFANGYAVALGYYDTNARESVYTNTMGHYLGRATAVVSASKAF
jgi:uncharacterized protein (TIGR02001 family)